MRKFLAAHPTELLLATLLTLAQIALVLASAPGADLAERYYHFYKWDSGWYSHIAANGYIHEEELKYPLRQDRNNVAFFPGLPVAARLIYELTPLSVEFSVVAAAQIAAWLLWLMLLLLLKNFAVPLSLRIWCCWLLFCSPGSFFLVTAYPESLCLALALAMTLAVCSERPRFVLATSLGIAMTFTHVRGSIAMIPLFFIGCLWWWHRDQQPGQHSDQRRAILKKLFLTCTASCSGFLFFLIYCQIKFGAWDLYRQSQAAGWFRRSPQWNAIFNIDHYHFSVQFLYSTGDAFLIGANRWWGSVLITACVLAALYELLRATRRKNITWLTGLAASLPLIAFALVSASYSDPVSDQRPFYALIRYGLVIELFLLLWLGARLSQNKVSILIRRLALLVGVVSSACLLWLQLKLLDWFILGWFVA